MKTEFTLSNKDNFATAALIVVTLFSLATGLFTSNQAEAKAPISATASASVKVQRMPAIVVTASRNLQRNT